ncbi:hypothetical protein L211DRAFT_669585 [Terfezia boudieri ATCC MYA-4762]|uniref:Uncharacterized protein n=1 Tax=Terfezia boudieri ATCC MYA-4762 TaxID=1051890 RepID=A0A3N4L8M4_9PEZI|nr:hypothetical protein L211DRAFT_669585 [Terfezia boudieri ATCC MYA-4762]
MSPWILSALSLLYSCRLFINRESIQDEPWRRHIYYGKYLQVQSPTLPTTRRETPINAMVETYKLILFYFHVCLYPYLSYFCVFLIFHGLHSYVAYEFSRAGSSLPPGLHIPTSQWEGCSRS